MPLSVRRVLETREESIETLNPVSDSLQLLVDESWRRWLAVATTDGLRYGSSRFLLA